MTNSRIAKLQIRRDELAAEAGKYLDRLAESDSDEALTEAERANFETIKSELAVLDARIAELTEWEAGRTQAAQTDAQIAGIDRRSSESGTGHTFTEGRPDAPTVHTLGRMYRDSILAQYGNSPNGQSAALETNFGVITTKDVNGYNIAPFTRLEDAAIGARPTPLIDAMSYEPTRSDIAEWEEWPVQPELAGGPIKEGDLLPEISEAITIRQAAMDWNGALLPVTRQALLDNTRMESKISVDLVDSCRLKAESDSAKVIMAGKYAKTEADYIEIAVRYAVAEISKYWVPTHVLMNPMDKAAIDVRNISRTLAGLKIDAPIWGLIPVTSANVPEGQVIVAAMREAFKFIDRQDFQVSITDSHNDRFGRSIWTLKGEQRYKTVIQRVGAAILCQANKPASDAYSDKYESTYAFTPAEAPPADPKQIKK